jgi:hypothetical protein
MITIHSLSFYLFLFHQISVAQQTRANELFIQKKNSNYSRNEIKGIPIWASSTMLVESFCFCVATTTRLIILYFALDDKQLREWLTIRKRNYFLLDSKWENFSLMKLLFTDIEIFCGMKFIWCCSLWEKWVGLMMKSKETHCGLQLFENVPTSAWNFC